LRDNAIFIAFFIAGEIPLLSPFSKQGHFPWLAGGNASATCLKMLVMRFADESAPLSLHSMFKAQYKCQVIIINTFISWLKHELIWAMFDL